MAQDSRNHSSLRHGFVPPPAEITAARREAVREVMRALEGGPKLERFSALRDAALQLADVFLTIRQQKKSEWFLTSGMMSHPTPHIARGTGKRISRLALACDRRDLHQVFELLDVMGALPKRLDNFLACTRARSPIAANDDARWIYLAGSKTEWGVVKFGEIDGPVLGALREVEELNPHFGKF
jgi:hypothetical protein